MNAIKFHISAAGSWENPSGDSQTINLSAFEKRRIFSGQEQGKIQMKQWGTGSFFAAQTTCSFPNSGYLIREIQGPAFCLSFTSPGVAVYRYERLLSKGTAQPVNNLFFTTHEKIFYLTEQEKQATFFDMLLSLDYLRSLTDRHPCLFNKLYKRSTREGPFELFRNPPATTPEMSRIIEQIKKLQGTGPVTTLFLESKMLELLALQLGQREDKTCRLCNNCFIHCRNQIKDAKNIIEDRFRNPPRIHELAIMVGICDTQLKAGFKFLYGKTIYSYLFDYRMNVAERLLKETSKSIAEIADCTGYEHQSHFTTAFKRKLGITPFEYRKYKTDGSTQGDHGFHFQQRFD